MQLSHSVLLAAILTTACTGPVPGVPPVEFRLNSPASPTAVTDNHQETHHQETYTTNMQFVQQPVLVAYAYPVFIPAAATAPSVAPQLSVAGPPSAPLNPPHPLYQPNPGATAVSPSAVAAAGNMLDNIAATELQGMQPLGAPIGGQFHEGQTLELSLLLSPGRCYSVVGAAAGIQELDITLVVWTPGAPAVARRASGQTPVVASRDKGCFRNTLARDLPSKVVVRAARGSGLAVARVYVDR